MQLPKIGVIGAGIMGSNHFRVAMRNPEVELVAICDNDLDKLESLSLPPEISIVQDPKKMFDLVDAVIVATPTETHFNLAQQFLNESIPVLVEKPIASTVQEGSELIELSERNSVPFMVGHIERFNSAVMALPEFLENPYHFEFRRISPYSGRVRESIVFDLMIHDLELLCFLNPFPIVDVQAIAQSPRSEWNDFASVLIKFENGSTAMLTASRIGQQKIRSIEVSQTDSVVMADLLRQDILISRVDHVEYTSEGGARFKQHGVMEIPFIERYGEPLVAEQQEFIRSVQRKGNVALDPRTALNALELAYLIESSVAERLAANV